MPTVCSLMRTSRGPRASSFSMGKSRRESLCFSSRTSAFTNGLLTLADDDDGHGEHQDVADPERQRLLEETHPEELHGHPDIDGDEQPVEPVGDDRQEAVPGRRGGGELRLLVNRLEIGGDVERLLRLCHAPYSLTAPNVRPA